MSGEIDNPIEQLFELEQLLSTGAITSKDAEERISEITKHHHSWHTKYWKKRREDLIGDSCIQCGAKAEDTVLVIQHLWHPLGIYDLRGVFYKQYGQVNAFSQEQIDEIEKQLRGLKFPERDACPNCSSVNIRFRQSDQMNICGKCKQEFATPVRITDPNAYKKAESELWNKIGRSRYDTFMADEDWQRKVTIEDIHNSYRYMSLHDTVTFCKKCAFLWDQEHKKICSFCHTNYIDWDQSICHHCQYDENTGIFTLTEQNAYNLSQYNDSPSSECEEIEDRGMAYFACVLSKNGITVLEVGLNALKVKANYQQVRSSLSGGTY